MQKSLVPIKIIGFGDYRRAQLTAVVHIVHTDHSHLDRCGQEGQEDHPGLRVLLEDRLGQLEVAATKTQSITKYSSKNMNNSHVDMRARNV